MIPANPMAKIGKGWIGFFLLLSLTGLTPRFSADCWGQEDIDITSTSTYYIAKGIIDSYFIQYGMRSLFQKKPIATDLRPRDVYQRTLTVLDEFNTLFSGRIPESRLTDYRELDADQATPAEIAGILRLMTGVLEEDGQWQPWMAMELPKTPDDVFQIMREIGWMHRHIATERGISTEWDRVERVYDAVVRDCLPAVYEVARKNKVKVTPYAFPPQGVRNVKSRNIYKLVAVLYQEIMISHKESNAPEINPVSDCDDISPADVFDLLKIFGAELKTVAPAARLSADMEKRYQDWRAGQQSLVPGHTFRLLQHLYIVMKAANRGNEGPAEGRRI